MAKSVKLAAMGEASEIRAAFCLSRGGWGRRPLSAVLKAWEKLPEATRAAYRSKLGKLSGAERDKFLADLGEPAAELGAGSAVDGEVKDGDRDDVGHAEPGAGDTGG